MCRKGCAAAWVSHDRRGGGGGGRELPSSDWTHHDILIHICEAACFIVALTLSQVQYAALHQMIMKGIDNSSLRIQDILDLHEPHCKATHSFRRYEHSGPMQLFISTHDYDMMWIAYCSDDWERKTWQKRPCRFQKSTISQSSPPLKVQLVIEYKCRFSGGGREKEDVSVDSPRFTHSLAGQRS